jgi:hypothetical protein
MNKNFKGGKTINSFLSAKKNEVRNNQIAELDKYINERLIQSKKIIRFVKYWGASDKKYADKFDYEALFHLFGFLRIVEKQYKIEVHLTLIFTDTHAMLNGYIPENYKNYNREIGKILNDFNYSHVLMSEVLTPFAKSHNLKDTNELIKSVIQQSKNSNIPQAIKNDESFEVLKKSASKHALRFKDKSKYKEFHLESEEQAAYSYILLNRIERQYVEKNFFQSVFLTYTSDIEKELIAPDLPTLQIYSIHKGLRCRPWFSFYSREDNK